MEGGQKRQIAPRVKISSAGGLASPDILNVNIQAEHNDIIRDTEDISKAANKVKYYNWRIMDMIKWVEK